MQEQKYDYPTEVITLPSEGKVYPESNPLSKGTVEIKYMTAKEEEILASQNLIKKGIVLDKLFESIIVDKDINPADIIVGDKNAIMLATRILAYGPSYEVEIYNSRDEKETVKIDLSKVQTKEIDTSILRRENRYNFKTPSGYNLVIKLLSHGDEQKIDEEIKALSKLNKSGVSAELTTRYRFIIVEVDGKSDTKSIVDFINNKFVTRDTRALREFIKTFQPDVVMEYEYEDPESGEKEVRPIPMGVGFFYPSI